MSFILVCLFIIDIPSVRLDPPIISETMRYVTESNVMPRLKCVSNFLDFPRPTTIEIQALFGEGVVARTFSENTLDFFFQRPLTSVSDSGPYSCSVSSAAGFSTVTVTIDVRGK